MSKTPSTAIVAKSPHAVAPSAWRRQQGESEGAHIAFLWWALCGGDLVPRYAQRHSWAHRRKVIESFEALESINPGDLALDATVARIQIVFTEIMKLRERSLSTHDPVISTAEIFGSIDWMVSAAQGSLSRRSASLDWSKLNPEERDIMIQAKRIQDRLIDGAISDDD